MYTQFLAEQLQAMDEQMSADPEAAGGQKRKAGKQGARARKKGVATKTTEGSKRVRVALPATDCCPQAPACRHIQDILQCTRLSTLVTARTAHCLNQWRQRRSTGSGC